MIVRPAHPIASALVALAIALPASAQVTFSIDDASGTLADIPVGAGRPITSGDILAPPGGTPEFPQAGTPLQTPEILVGGGTTPGPQGGLGIGTADSCIGIEEGNRCRAEVNALSYGDDDLVFDVKSFLGVTANVQKARWFFSVDEYAEGVAGLGVDPTTESENRLVPGLGNLAGNACADVFANLKFSMPPPLGPLDPAAGNIGISDGDGFPSTSSFMVYPGLGLKEPFIPLALPLPFVGDNLDALDCDGTGFPGTSFPIFYSLDSTVFDPKDMAFGTGTAAANGFSGADIVTTLTMGAMPAVYAPAALLGLDMDGVDTDDIDALVLHENGTAGFQPSLTPYDWIGGATDQLFFSVRRGSSIVNNPLVVDSIFGVEIEAGDILVPPVSGGNGFPGIFIAAEILGLKTKRAFDPCGDDLDALDYKVKDTLIQQTYCFGDGGVDVGGGTFCRPCPCGNDVPALTQTGCENSSGVGARLAASGLASLAGDTLRFEVTGMTPSNFGIMVHGGLRLPLLAPCIGAGLPQPALLDGLRCVGDTVRAGVRPSNAGGTIGTTTPGWGPPDGPTGGLLSFAGLLECQERQFMVIYRDTTAVNCGTGLNTTNGVQITGHPLTRIIHEQNPRQPQPAGFASLSARAELRLPEFLLMNNPG